MDVFILALVCLLAGIFYELRHGLAALGQLYARQLLRFMSLQLPHLLDILRGRHSLRQMLLLIVLLRAVHPRYHLMSHLLLADIGKDLLSVLAAHLVLLL